MTSPDVRLIRLYVAGAAPASTRAVEVLRTVLDEHLGSQWDLQVIDVYQQPQMALDDRVMTVPSLVIRAPGSTRRLAGPFSDPLHVLAGLDLHDPPVEIERRHPRPS